MAPPSPCDPRQLERLLLADPLRNVSNLGFWRNNPITHRWFASGAAMFRGISDHEWIYVAATDEAQLIDLLAQLDPRERYFAALEEWMEPLVLKDQPPVWRLVTRRFVLPPDAPAPSPDPDARPLRPADADRVHRLSQYRDLAPADYIRARIERGPSVGIQHSGELVAWGLTHDDGALGMIHVLPEARRQGLGAAVLASLAHLVLTTGHIPFSQIEEDNTPSIALHRALGFVADRRISWLERSDRGVPT